MEMHYSCYGLAACLMWKQRNVRGSKELNKLEIWKVEVLGILMKLQMFLGDITSPSPTVLTNNCIFFLLPVVRVRPMEPRLN